jgi:hypothetical protein
MFDLKIAWMVVKVGIQMNTVHSWKPTAIANLDG